jgi:hypothetical protein
VWVVDHDDSIRESLGLALRLENVATALAAGERA